MTQTAGSELFLLCSAHGRHPVKALVLHLVLPELKVKSADQPLADHAVPDGAGAYEQKAAQTGDLHSRRLSCQACAS